MPAVDIVLLHLKQKTHHDVPQSQQTSFCGFVQKGLRHGIHSLLTKKQVATALRLAGLSDIPLSGTMLYVQWLCLFRCWRQFQGREG